MQSNDFIVARQDLETCRTISTERPDRDALPSDALLVKVDRFAFTANNITYALLGEQLKYWQLFPAPDGFGIIPVWGFGDVIASRNPAVAEGERLFGYFPMATHLCIEAADISKRSLRDAAAHQAGARVTAHAFSHKAIAGLLDAGIDCIEHGSGIDSDQAQECVRRGIPVTPTLLQVELFNQFAAQAGKKYPVYAATMQQMWEQRREHFAMLHQSGVQLLPGTDSGGYQPHGELGRELSLWERGGVSPHQIIDFATWRARDYLGIGALEPGARADYLRYSSNPAGDLARATKPEKVALLGQEFSPAVAVS
ncbi:DUF2855 family protein [Bradyrhizobium sp.]|uniref:DUF2855 family protein n=1 Tax=Bradyrhizobium sp. TaxID=376 RepID=UPI0029121B17|nr:DUF2855 family protein [Bradyrhizobium sp.]MDU6494562.1 DUF2855 family protein [Bradyrhizobium sp.]